MAPITSYSRMAISFPIVHFAVHHLTPVCHCHLTLSSALTHPIPRPLPRPFPGKIQLYHRFRCRRGCGQGAVNLGVVPWQVGRVQIEMSRKEISSWSTTIGKVGPSHISLSMPFFPSIVRLLHHVYCIEVDICIIFPFTVDH